MKKKYVTKEHEYEMTKSGSEFTYLGLHRFRCFPIPWGLGLAPEVVCKMCELEPRGFIGDRQI